MTRETATCILFLGALAGCKTSTSDAPQPAPLRDAEPATKALVPASTSAGTARPEGSARPAGGEVPSVPKTWCLAREGVGVSDRLVPPFTMDAAKAMRLTLRTKHVHALYRRYRELFIDDLTFECARVCEPRSYECGFHFRLIDTTGGGRKEVEWVYVDPFERKLWFPEEAGWSSEDLVTE